MAYYTDDLLVSLKENLKNLQAIKTEVTRLNEKYKSEYSAMLAGSKHAAKTQRVELDDRHKKAINKAIKSFDTFDLLLLQAFTRAGEWKAALLDRVKTADQFAGELFEGKAPGVNRYIDLLISEHIAFIAEVETKSAG
jgi:hypothetical protein